MRFKQYKTDEWIWFLSWSVLFSIPWFLQFSDRERGDFRPIELIREIPQSPGKTIGEMFVFALSFGIPALVAGWIIQCIIVIIRNWIRKDPGDEPTTASGAPPPLTTDN
jgi:hypothetical protein